MNIMETVQNCSFIHRRMNEADVDQFDDDFEDDDRLMQADRTAPIHRTRHFRQRKRRKGTTYLFVLSIGPSYLRSSCRPPTPQTRRS